MQRVELKIGGQAGEGIKTTGLMLNKTLVRLGFHTFGYSEYPSLIRGGHNVYQLSVADQPVSATRQKVDILIALNQETINLHQTELHQNSIIIYDPGEFSLPKTNLVGDYLPVELIKLAEGIGGKALMANVVALAAVLVLLGLPIDKFLEILKETFARKGQEIVDLNQKAAQAGYAAIKTKSKFNLQVPDKAEPKMVLTANEAAGLGAIAGGLQFYSAYPMTPATSILHYLAKVAKKANLVVKQTEDEISAINMALGASYAGVRSMTATSGGGLCLMAEGISFSGVAELPMVIVNAMRPGPGLGMPTWTGQGDLRFCLHIGHDEFPRIVLAPGDAEEMFKLTKLALVLAEKYQLPVIILTDKHLAESDFCYPQFEPIHQHKRLDQVRRYVNSYEHDNDGFATEDPQVRTEQMNKRMAKLTNLIKEIPQQPIYQVEAKKIGLISWGSNKGAILDALKDLPQASFLHLNWLWPLPAKAIQDFAGQVEQLVIVEGNSQAQLAGLIREQLEIEIKHKILKYDGRPFWPNEIVEKVKKLLTGN
ncbi:2-oxoacid:acceptor oxidoreductase subunit alpha [Patescibacteria group bacterium]|nr:2-oxoacid:acceptor oxidoreductase subunit alpha [Patescibacteria group bacterium]